MSPFIDLKTKLPQQKLLFPMTAAIGKPTLNPIPLKESVTEEMKIVALRIATLLVHKKIPSFHYNNHPGIDSRMTHLERAFINYATKKEKGPYPEISYTVMTLFTQCRDEIDFIEKYANLLGYTLIYSTFFQDYKMFTPHFCFTSTNQERKLQKIHDELNLKALHPPIIVEKASGYDTIWKLPIQSIVGIREL